MSSGIVKRFDFNLQGPNNPYNRILIRRWFQKLSEMFWDLTKFKNKKEFSSYRDELITFLLSRYDCDYHMDYAKSKELKFNDASPEAKLALIKEVEILNELNRKLKMEIFF